MKLTPDPTISDIVKALLTAQCDRLGLFQRDRFGDPVRAAVFLSTSLAVACIGPRLKEIAKRLGNPAQNQALPLSPQAGVRSVFTWLATVNQNWAWGQIGFNNPEPAQLLVCAYTGASVRFVYSHLKNQNCPVYFF